MTKRLDQINAYRITTDKREYIVKYHEEHKEG